MSVTHIPLRYILEMLKKVEFEGPCGKVQTLGIVDSGATHTMIAEDVYNKVCLENERKGYIIVADGSTVTTKTGELKMKMENCPDMKTTVFVGPFTLIGMEYLSKAKAVIDTEEGTIVCKLVKEKLADLAKEIS